MTQKPTWVYALLIGVLILGTVLSVGTFMLSTTGGGRILYRTYHTTYINGERGEEDRIWLHLDDPIVEVVIVQTPRQPIPPEDVLEEHRRGHTYTYVPDVQNITVTISKPWNLKDEYGKTLDCGACVISAWTLEVVNTTRYRHRTFKVIIDLRVTTELDPTEEQKHAGQWVEGFRLSAQGDRPWVQWLYGVRRVAGAKLWCDAIDGAPRTVLTDDAIPDTPYDDQTDDYEDDYIDDPEDVDDAPPIDDYTLLDDLQYNVASKNNAFGITLSIVALTIVSAIVLYVFGRRM